MTTAITFRIAPLSAATAIGELPEGHGGWVAEQDVAIAVVNHDGISRGIPHFDPTTLVWPEQQPGDRFVHQLDGVLIFQGTLSEQSGLLLNPRPVPASHTLIAGLVVSSTFHSDRFPGRFGTSSQAGLNGLRHGVGIPAILIS